MRLFHEVHCDDLLLERRRDRATYEAARAAVEAICGVAEARGIHLALRFRHLFAEAALAFEGPDNGLARLAERGHEIGAHAHRRKIRRSVEAIRAAGVGDVRAVVPGFIQSTRRQCAHRLAACRGLGFAWATDQVQLRAFAYGGLTPWRPAPDFSGPGDGPLVFIEPSVNPFAWGMLEHTPDGTRQVYGLRDAQFDRLLALLDAHRALPAPHPITHFGYVFHEHQHTRSPDDPTVDAESLAAWDRFLERAAGAGVQSALPGAIYADWIALEGAPAPDRPRGALLPALDRRDLRYDAPSWVHDRLPTAPAAAPRARRWLAWSRRRPAAALQRRRQGAEILQIPVPSSERGSGRSVRAARYAGPSPRGAVVVSVSGTFGGLVDQVAHFGLTPRQIADRGWVVWLFDRTGTGPSRGPAELAPGSPLHADDAAAVWAAAAREGLPTGWLTWSAGILPPLLALPRARPAFLIDAESPADRRSILAPAALSPLEAERLHLAAADPGAAGPPEPARLLRDLPCPYHRLQAARDHRHGRGILHARVMLDAAPPGARLNGGPWTGWLFGLRGALHDHGDVVLRALEMELARAAS